MKLEIFKGALWTFLFRLIDRGLGLISVLVLARLLVPADFGLIAMATALTAMVELFTAFGFELALLQRANPQRVHYDSAWTLNLLTAISGAGVIALLAWPASQFFGEPRLVAVMLVLSGSMLLGGLENIGTVDFRRQMNFRGEFRFMAGRRLTAFTVTICAALATGSYWALLAGTISGRVVGIVLSYVMQPYRPRLSLGAAGDLVRFSGWTLFSGALTAGIQRSPQFVIGRFWGPTDLGLFVLAMDLGTMPTTELAAPVNRAAMAGYSRLAADSAALRSIFLDVGAMVAMVALPAGVGLAVFAEPIVFLLLGTKWLEVAPLLQILAFSGVFVALASNNGVACIASGRPKLNTWIHGSRLIALALLMAVFGPWLGLQGIAWAEALSAAIGYAVSCVLGFNCVEVSWRDVARRSWRVMVATAVTAVATRAVLDAWPPLDGAAAALRQLAVVVPLALLGSLGLTWLLWNAAGRPAGSETQLFGMARGVFDRRLRPG
jgi:O-antigen/teichoic acid export membrane protein